MDRAWSAERMLELGTRHADLEARGDLEGLMATLVANPVYDFHPLGMRMEGGDRVRRYYEQFIERFIPMTHSYQLLGEWVNQTAVAQEYEISLRVDGAVETHHVVGILYAVGDLLGGERIYGSERFVRLMAGDLFEELTPIPAS